MEAIPTERQRELLTKVRTAIRKEPESYSQKVYGIGTVSCHTPACIAGHIVASEPELQEQVKQRLKTEDLSEPDAMEEIGSFIHELAWEALGAAGDGRLFHAMWPMQWLNWQTPKGHQNEVNGRFEPTAKEAVAVIEGILDGRIPNALR